ncbi:MAG: putative bifunctional diguanylate cyclase/phosphodiesterase [Ilumatobacteraceae bacterium]
MRPAGAVGEVTYVAVTLGAGVAASIGARRQPASRRFPWMCVAVGVTLSGIGDAIYYAMGEIQGSLSDLSIADAFWVAAYVAVAIGLSSLIVGSGSRRVDFDGLIDIGSFAVLAVIVVSQLSVVRDTLADTSATLLARLTWTAYPMLDAALLGVVTQAIVSKRMRNLHGLFLSLGVALWLVADFALLFVSDKTAVTTWLDVGWMVGAASIAVSAWPSTAPQSRPDQTLVVDRMSDARIAITLAPLLVPASIELWAHTRGYDPAPVPLFVATTLLVGLAFARSTRLVRARNRQEEALERKTWYYTALAENSSDAVIVVDRNGRILNDAPNLAAMLGRPGKATTGMNVIDLLQLVDRDAALAVLERWSLTTGVVAESEVRATNVDGSDRWFGVRAANLIGDPVVGGLVINLRDVTDRKRAEEELSHNALHDALTGLANRALFHDRLAHALERTSRTGLEVAVVYLDLDGFKMVNDSRGHEAGDLVLREVAARLTAVVRSIDTVSRHGGDEFAILIEESGHALDEAQTVADRVLQSLTKPFVVDDQQVVLSASIGITIGDVTCSASSMMRDADLAMYKAKATGRAQWATYDPAMRTAALEQLELENDLRMALEKHQFRLMYQPVIELQTNMVVGFEALIRWDHPTIGVIDPDAFIHIAEGNGTIVAIGKWVLEEACRTAAKWQSTYPHSQLTMAVNLSARQIATPDLVDHVAKALEESGLPPSSLVLEMTESVLVQDAAVAAERLGELRGLGVRLAIDDFGTGYSSLSYLRQFPIDILKIDKSFTETITDKSLTPAIVRGLLDLAKTLRIATVAEGIEFDVQRDSLRDQHCDYGQGFLFARPLNIDDASALIAELRPSVPA